MDSARPWTYFSLEFGLPEYGLSYAGGLGILAGDTFLQALELNIPFVGVGLYYTHEKKSNFNPYDYFHYEEVVPYRHPKECGYEQVGEVDVKANGNRIRIFVFERRLKEGRLVVLYEPGLGGLYEGGTSSEHRVYQEVVLGFGGMRALEQLGVAPGLLHLNESATVMAGLARLDSLVSRESLSLTEGLKRLRNRTVLTNHTLVQAAVGIIPKELFENYVYPNLESEDVIDWVNSLLKIKEGRLNLSILGMELAEKVNGVSKLHAEIAEEEFRKIDGEKAGFEAVTNGVCLRRWIDGELLCLYKGEGEGEWGLLDDSEAVMDDYQVDIARLSREKLKEIKEEARAVSRRFFQLDVTNQYGEEVVIPQEAKVLCWARRVVDYKRPWMMFEDLERLQELLERYNMYIVMTGRVHPGAKEAKKEIQRWLRKFEKNEVMRKRFQFIPGYSTELAKRLVMGADVWLNTPVVGKEACGTSWMKSVGNLGILISTHDGGVADVGEPVCLVVEGEDYGEEVDSLYRNIEHAGELLEDRDAWSFFVKHQLSAYLPTISAGRMLEDYLELWGRGRFDMMTGDEV